MTSSNGNIWVNNCESGDLKRYHAHYDVSVMEKLMFENAARTPNEW